MLGTVKLPSIEVAKHNASKRLIYLISPVFFSFLQTLWETWWLTRRATQHALSISHALWSEVICTFSSTSTSVYTILWFTLRSKTMQDVYQDSQQF